MNQSRLSTLKRPVLIAHRGYNTRYPENTLAAFEAALKSGAEMIELDITLSRDRNMVVIHDDTLDRTSNGEGAVSDCSLRELKELDAGSWFDIKFAGEKIPTLLQVLEHVPALEQNVSSTRVHDCRRQPERPEEVERLEPADECGVGHERRDHDDRRGKRFQPLTRFPYTRFSALRCEAAFSRRGPPAGRLQLDRVG